jgi:CDGSH-type Zn-finger protein
MTNPPVDPTSPAAQVPPPQVEIMVRRNGSLRVTGDFRLVDHEGKEIPRPVGKPNVALCRCGQSLKKPFCDSAHKTCGFFDPPEAAPNAAPIPAP